jgi:hypothetical protein
MVATGMAILSLRSNFAINHLRAAARAARDAYDIEQANATAAFGVKGVSQDFDCWITRTGQALYLLMTNERAKPCRN